MSYNLADALTQVADPRNLATSYNPNGLGQVKSQVSPDTGSTQYSYDETGNRTSKTQMAVRWPSLLPVVLRGRQIIAARHIQKVGRAT